MVSTKLSVFCWEREGTKQSHSDYRVESMENIFTVAKPFLVFARFLGLFSLSFEGPARKGILRVKLVNIAITVCTIMILIFLMAVTLFFNASAMKSNSTIISQAWTCATCFEYSSLLCLVAYQFLKRKDVLKFLTQIEKIDDQVRRNCDENVEKWLKWSTWMAPLNISNNWLWMLWICESEFYSLDGNQQK